MKPRPMSAFSFLHDRMHSIDVSIHCGVYFLVSDGGVIYVGQSANILRRVTSGHGEKVFGSVFFLDVPRVDLDDVEGAFIRLLNPPKNRGTRFPPSALDDLAVISRYAEGITPVNPSSLTAGFVKESDRLKNREVLRDLARAEGISVDLRWGPRLLWRAILGLRLHG